MEISNRKYAIQKLKEATEFIGTGICVDAVLDMIKGLEKECDRMDKVKTETIRKFLLTEEFLNVVSALKVPVEVVKDGTRAISGGCIVLTQENMFREGILNEDTYHDEELFDVVDEINEMFMKEKLPYFSHIFINQNDEVNIRVYRLSDEFELSKFVEETEKNKSRWETHKGETQKDTIEKVELLSMVTKYYKLEAKILDKLSQLPGYGEDCDCDEPSDFCVMDDKVALCYCLNCGGNI